MNNASLELGGTNWAAKDGNLLGYAVGDLAGKYVPREFTFTRGSNLSATRVNENGLIEKGRENLLLQSNQFDTTWGVQGTITGSQADKDGGTSAWSFIPASPTSGLFQNITTGGVQTFSAYVKKNATYGIRVYMFGSLNAAVYFDLNNGAVVSSTGGTVNASIEAYNSEWWRVSVTSNSTLSQVTLYSTNNASTQVLGEITIQDAQLEQGLAATDYIESGATTGKAGVLEDLPRLDYSDGTPSLLLEPSRTNTYASSEWILNLNSNLSQELSDINSPIENTPFLKLTKNTSGLARQSLYTSTNGDIDTCSVFAKKGSAGGNQIYFADSYYGFATMSASFDLDTGSWFVTPSGTALVDYGFENFGNGMYRIWVAGRTMDVSNPDPTRWRAPALYFDDGQLAVGEYIYITGLQTERNASYPTSYIPTYGVSQTRGAETCSGAIANTSGNYWTLFIDYANFNNGATSGDDSMVFRDSSNVSIFALWGLSNGFVIRSFSGDTDGNYYTQNSFGKTAKAIVRYDGAEIGLFVDGVKQTITSHSTLETNWNQLYKVYLLRASDNKYDFNQMLVFPEALSDADCITLTTL